MLQRRGDLDLAEEPVAAEHGRQLGLEHLDGDLPAVLQVLGEEHDRHPAVAELPLDAVPIAERRPELLEEVHGCPFTGERCLSNRWRQATTGLARRLRHVLRACSGVYLRERRSMRWVWLLARWDVKSGRTHPVRSSKHLSHSGPCAPG